MSEALAAPAAVSLSALPPLKAPFHGGLFAGLITLPDGTHHAVVLLPDSPTTRLSWKRAMDWAASVGGALPSRPIAALLYANCKPHLKPDWHWTNEPEGASYAWLCHFDCGDQHYYNRSAEGSAVAVRLIPLAD